MRAALYWRSASVSKTRLSTIVSYSSRRTAGVSVDDVGAAVVAMPQLSSK
ncbi:hypothetical protein LRS13_13660 [Svornostia abyssi]|uniref:Uncharacterized protein n=1 Tax=Svornostia abyssi TaxID=2898438 RepID=A0ABY5PAQ9_9ACTN|nr:hypothetical protein LRS13_13660 [Parviterribacteraceae bacterium J379]